MVKKDPGHIYLKINCVNRAITSKNNAYVLCKTGFEPEIVLSSVRAVIEEHEQSTSAPLSGPVDYTITNTSWRVLKLILGNTKLSNKWWGVNE